MKKIEPIKIDLKDQKEKVLKSLIKKSENSKEIRRVMKTLEKG